MKRSTDVAYWPDHLHPIFAAIGAAMDGKRLHPDILGRTELRSAVPEHTVMVQHRKGETGPQDNHYLIGVTGPRIMGQWPFRSGELEKLAREAYARGIGG
jgi:hypothetical protein